MSESHLADPPLPFQYEFRTHPKLNDGDPKICKRKYIYRFKNQSNKLYLVEVHELELDIFVIKFYQKNHKDSPDRYSLLTDEGYIRRILSTCAHIADDICKENARASFGFMGALTRNEEKRKEKGNSARYKVYKKFCFFFVRRDRFFHVGREEHNLHLLLNRSVYASETEAAKGLVDIEKMVYENYNIEEFLRRNRL